MTRSADALLTSIVDYAGTFPPAKLSLPDAMATFGRYRSHTDGWLLGRFVLPAAALDEFETRAPTFLSTGFWTVTIVGTAGSMPDAHRVSEFNRKWKGRAAIASAEFAPMDPAHIAAVARRFPSDLETFFEVPLDGHIDASLAQIAQGHGRAKVRTGGITSEAFPDVTALTDFIRACHAAGVAFKATAGLHHALRGSYPLTYDAQSPRAHMFGFLNVAVAAALVHAGGDAADVPDLLRESSARSLVFSDDGITWRERRLTTEQLAAARRCFFKGFGSCALAEPVEELAGLGLVARHDGPVASHRTEGS